MLENQNSTGGLRRSWRLVRGSFWRVLGISILLYILVAILSSAPSYLVAFVSLAVPSILFSTVANTVVTTLVQTLITPIQYAAITLLYYDLRIRKEGFDLELLSQAPRLPSSTSELSGAPA